MTLPDHDELEVSLLGPGFGESVVLHVGAGKWIIIDSCINAADNVPAPLFYLHNIGVETDTSVELVVVTHWHDDHIRGMGKLLRGCSSARVCVPAAMIVREFLEAVLAQDVGFSGGISSGVSEIRQVFESDQMNSDPLFATENQILWEGAKGELLPGGKVELRALSPAGVHTLTMYRRLAKMLDDTDRVHLRGRTPRAGSNDLAIATWLSVGERTVLLGADLEIHANQACGWGGVRRLIGGLPGGKAEVFKVPHHGSENGHDPLVWQKLLEKDPIALVSPWNHGRGLPQQRDLDRISNFTQNGYITNPGKVLKAVRRDPVVEKIVRDARVKLWTAQGQLGHVRLRRKPDAPWKVECFGPATKFGAAA